MIEAATEAFGSIDNGDPAATCTTGRGCHRIQVSGPFPVVSDPSCGPVDEVADQVGEGRVVKSCDR